jgi:hypothetical protein
MEVLYAIGEDLRGGKQTPVRLRYRSLRACDKVRLPGTYFVSLIVG